MDRVLITGGLGYIGSHTVVEMIEAGYEVVIIDSLANSELGVLDNIADIVGEKVDFMQLNLCDEPALNDFFNFAMAGNISAVIHFAAYKNVGESVANPLKYYDNNLNSLINTLAAMNRHAIPNLVYSSSCSVYGNPETIPVTEASPLQSAESPYANTKKIGEEIIQNSIKGQDMCAISLRYFNPIGAHPSNAIGEGSTEFADNLMPALTATVRGGQSQFSTYGDDYDTPDGTCVRDYIDVTDIAKAHVKAISRLLGKENEQGYEVFNLGTGKGASVMEMIKMVEKVSGVDLPYIVKPRREGDVEAVYADPGLANKKLGWKSERSLEETVATAWAWSGVLERKNDWH